MQNSIKIFDTESGRLQNELLNPQHVNQCWTIAEDEKVISCCKDSIVRMYYTLEEDITEQLAAEFKGHKLSVTNG